MTPAVVDDILRAALAAEASRYVEKGLTVVLDLEARGEVSNHDRAIRKALETIVRIVPARAVPGSAVCFTTRDRAGGDVELSFETLERFGTGIEEDDAEAALKGPHEDLLRVVMFALEVACRGRTTASVTPLDAAEGSRRVTARALIPSLCRDGIDPTGIKARQESV
ncbi:MAG TPA: hypothetical protein VM889_12155 [Candidatus Thermoplasmatota archaeon]|nr:hypothetical protein [Candidatus Thermoplasmatota archaeon]